MATDLNGLARRMTQIASTVERNAPRAVREVAKAIAPVLVYATPVDTSRARANWQAGIAHVPTSVLYAEPDSPPSPDYGGQAATSAIIATANLYPGGSYLAIANNVRYIQRLNQGWSSQAPAMFVQQAVMVGLSTLRGFRILGNVH